MLLHKPQDTSFIAPAELERRFIAFARGEWAQLIEMAEPSKSTRPMKQRSPEEDERHRQDTACARVRMEECRKARQALTSSALAPGNQATLNELQDPAKRRREATERLPEDVLNFQPPQAVDIKFSLFTKVLKSAPRGTASGPGDTTTDLLKVALDEEDTARLLHRAAVRLARAEIPACIADAFMSARMTALLKPNGRVRGIATGTAFRRTVASCLARVVGKEVEAACAPFQYALSTRAGTECVGHMFRAATDLNPHSCVLSIDGIGAFDHIKRASMLSKLASLPTASAILPFVRLSYSQPTQYVWTDDDGRDHEIAQGEGGEQGDPLMPLLFALGIHDALQAVSAHLRPGEDLAAFLDDVYVLCPPERVRTIYDALEAALADAGIELHSGKTRVWNKAGERPPGIADLGGEEGAWSPEGVVLLGAPVGTPEFVRAHAAERLQEEQVLLSKLAKLDDPQCAWQLLSRCAVPRGNYWLRTLPPSASSQYACARDDAIWTAALQIFRAENLTAELLVSGRRVAQLPSRLGGLGLRSSTRTAPAAFWASWADALGMIQARNPQIASEILSALEAGPAEGCLAELQASARLLRSEGFDSLPSWADLAAGLRPPPLPTSHDQAERTPGWQYFSSSTVEAKERRKILSSMCRSARALLRSQSGLGASQALSSAPTCPECTLAPEVFQGMIRRRLRWPLPLSSSSCSGCGCGVDTLGDHLSSCMRSGRVKLRATPIEQAVARICREAGARVRSNVFLRNLNVATEPNDRRQLEVIASGLPVLGGSQLAIDVTLRSPLQCNGEPRAQADWCDGATAEAARADKEAKYPELATGARCRLVVLALETGGRFSRELGEFLRQLAHARSLAAPSFLRAATAAAYERRWSRMLAVSATSSYIQSILMDKEDLANLASPQGREPWLQHLLTESRAAAPEPLAAAPVVSVDHPVDIPSPVGAPGGA